MFVNLFHGLIGLSGLLILYAGIFLTETEEGRLQNVLEELWIHVDDLHSTAMSRQVAFLQQVSRLAEHGIATVFGQKLFSVKSLASCLCFAQASTFLSLALLVDASPAFPRFVTLIVSVFFLICALSQKLRYLGFILPSLGAILGLIGLAAFAAYRLSFGDMAYSSVGIALSILLVVGSIALTRWSLRSATQMGSAAALVAIILANILLAAILEGPLLIALLFPRIFVNGPRFIRALPSGFLQFLFSMSGTTVFAAALSIVVVLVLVSALVHRMLWPVISRTVYAAHRHGLVRPKLLRVIGCACLGLAWPKNIVVTAFTRAVSRWIS